MIVYMKRIVYYITLVLIAVLVLLSVYGAFLGAARAQEFFNSLPLAVYWFFMIFLTIAAIMSFRQLRRPSLFLIHVGTILILLGSVLSSDKGHEIWSRFFKYPKPTKSQMVIYQGDSSNELQQQAENKVWQLPFEIRLNKFVVENYPSYLMVNFADGKMRKISAALGSESFLYEAMLKIRVVNVFENFKIALEGDKKTPVDSNQPGRNPAVELEITQSDGTIESRFIFELFKGHAPRDGRYHITYHRPIKDYISKVDVVKDGVVVKSADIEVNHPLYYNGFHFYQYSYDDKQHQYTILQVVSNTGLSTVYAGFAAICLGIIWYFWFTKLRQN